jgi:hypothetical protein
MSYDRDYVAEALERAGVKPNGARPTWRDQVFTAADLRRRTFPPVSYVIPGLIPEGLSLIAGRPKIGKSWFALDIAIAIAAGRFCLGELKPTQGDVLYAALEDNPRRLQRRIDKILSAFAESWPERLKLATSWRRLDKGGVEDVEEWIKEVEKPRLIILDTLAGVRPIRTQQGYTEDYDSLSALHRVVNDHGVGAVVLHHTRKAEADDPIDSVSGTLGLSGCADTIAVLNRTAQGTTLYVRGRDVEEAEHAITFNKQTCRWTILGDAEEIHRSAERTKVLDVLKGAPDGLSVREIQAAADIKSRNAADQLLGRMATAGQIERLQRGKYGLPGGCLSDQKDSQIAPAVPVSDARSDMVIGKMPAVTAISGTYDNLTDLTGGSKLHKPALGPEGDSLDDFI